MSSDLRCPFCSEADFDDQGLKAHLEHGDCDAFEAIPRTNRLFGSSLRREAATLTEEEKREAVEGMAEAVITGDDDRFEKAEPALPALLERFALKKKP